MKQDLRHFLHPSPLPSRWLLIESSEYIPHLLARCPAARITSVESDADIAALPRFAGFDVDWVTADFRTELLPVGRGSFDFVLTDVVLTESCRPYETLLGLATVLTDTGTLLASFRNLRYSGVLEALRQGQLILCTDDPDRENEGDFICAAAGRVPAGADNDEPPLLYESAVGASAFQYDVPRDHICARRAGWAGAGTGRR